MLLHCAGCYTVHMLVCVSDFLMIINSATTTLFSV